MDVNLLSIFRDFRFLFFEKIVNLKKIKIFSYLIIFFFFLSPVTYFYISSSNDFKRTDFPGKEISRLVQKNGTIILLMK